MFPTHLYDQLILIEEMTLIRDVTVQKEFYPLIAVHESGLFVFLEAEKPDENKQEITNSVYPLQQLLSLSRAKMHVYSELPDGSWTYLNPCTDDTEKPEDVCAHIRSLIESRTFLIDKNRATYYSQKLMFGAGYDQVKSMPDGKIYVKRGSHWYPASSEDPDDVYKQTCLYGAFGWLQYHRGRRASGFIYTITCGLFTAGWLLDILSFLLGCAKDDEGKYYPPLSDAKRSWLMFLLCILAALILLIVYRFLLSLLNNGFISLLKNLSAGTDPGKQVSSLLS